MNYVSFVLYGNDPKYIKGAIANVSLVHVHYPQWAPIFYIYPSVPDEVTEELMRWRNPPIIVTGNMPCKMAARTLAVDREDAELVIARDCDSRITRREVLAVEEWVESGKAFHVMRDHVCHQAPIMGGMWGARAKETRELLPGGSMEALMRKPWPGNPDSDQTGLSHHVWPLIKDYCLQHDRLPNRGFGPTCSFPSDRPFVGEVYEIDPNGRENPRWADRLIQ